MLTLKKQISTKTNNHYYVLGIVVSGEFIPLTYDKQTILIYCMSKGVSLPTECGVYEI